MYDYLRARAWAFEAWGVCPGFPLGLRVAGAGLAVLRRCDDHENALLALGFIRWHAIFPLWKLETG
jgi:hypothetical protein